LMAAPSRVVSLLLGVALDTPADCGWHKLPERRCCRSLSRVGSRVTTPKRGWPGYRHGRVALQRLDRRGSRVQQARLEHGRHRLGRPWHARPSAFGASPAFERQALRTKGAGLS
jgi:hypothetical protein